MGRIMRELRSLSGAILGFVIIAIISFYVLNLLQTKAPAPISTASGWAFGRATGEAYAPAAPVMSTSPYSMNGNLGPAL